MFTFENSSNHGSKSSLSFNYTKIDKLGHYLRYICSQIFTFSNMVPTFAVTNSSFRLLLFLSILLWLSFHTFFLSIFIENFLFYCYISSSIILKLDPFIALSFSSSNFHQIACATKVNQTTTKSLFMIHHYKILYLFSI